MVSVGRWCASISRLPAPALPANALPDKSRRPATLSMNENSISRPIAAGGRCADLRHRRGADHSRGVLPHDRHGLRRRRARHRGSLDRLRRARRNRVRTEARRRAARSRRRSATTSAPAASAVVIDHVAEDDDFCGHPTPALYGFQSYISMPIFRRDGTLLRHAVRHRPASRRKLKNRRRSSACSSCSPS